VTFRILQENRRHMGWRLKRRTTLGLDGGLALAEAADLAAVKLLLKIKITRPSLRRDDWHFI
jgi:hypothetical protein